MVADHAREDDQVVEYRGSCSWSIRWPRVPYGVRMDCVETAEGNTELILVALNGKDDEVDPDADEESEH